MASANSTPDEDDILDDNIEVIHERAQGTKAKKLKERKKEERKFIEGLDVEFNYALARMTNDKMTFMVEKREAITKVERERSEQLALEKKKFKTKIMKLDIASMNAMQQGYFQSFQNEIYKASKKSTATSTFENPSAPFGGV